VTADTCRDHASKAAAGGHALSGWQRVGVVISIL